MIVCDDIYRDRDTGKQIIVGTFNTINLPSLPATHPRLVVLFTLTDANGDYDLALKIEHERTGQRVIEIKGPLRVTDPLAICDFNVVLTGVTFRDAGKHWIILESAGEVLMQRPIIVRVSSEASHEPTPDS